MFISGSIRCTVCSSVVLNSADHVGHSSCVKLIISQHEFEEYFNIIMYTLHVHVPVACAWCFLNYPAPYMYYCIVSDHNIIIVVILYSVSVCEV